MQFTVNVTVTVDGGLLPTYLRSRAAQDLGSFHLYFDRRKDASSPSQARSHFPPVLPVGCFIRLGTTNTCRFLKTFFFLKIRPTGCDEEKKTSLLNLGARKLTTEERTSRTRGRHYDKSNNSMATEHSRDVTAGAGSRRKSEIELRP